MLRICRSGQYPKIKGGFPLIKEAMGFGETIDEAKENAIKELNASDFDDVETRLVNSL